MANIVSGIKWSGAAIAGLFSWLYGGLDMLLAVLIACMVIDYITGVLAAGYTQTLDSRVGFKGILKKVVILAIVALGSLLGQVLGHATIRDVVIGFYIANEGISILENAGRMDVPVCKSLTKFLEQLKSEDDDHKE